MAWLPSYRCSQLTHELCIVTQAMERLHLVADIPTSDTALAVMQSDWARFLPDSTMLDVSLYWGRHLYAARLQHHAIHLVADAYKGRAIRSVREHLNSGPNSPSDSLIAAILILTVLEVRLASEFACVLADDFVSNSKLQTILKRGKSTSLA